MSGGEKKVNENAYDISSITCVTKKFLEVSCCSCAKQWQRNVQKSVPHVQSCFFANYTNMYCCFFTVLWHYLQLKKLVSTETDILTS